jgi:hypothetical protein
MLTRITQSTCAAVTIFVVTAFSWASHHVWTGLDTKENFRDDKNKQQAVGKGITAKIDKN